MPSIGTLLYKVCALIILCRFGESKAFEHFRHRVQCIDLCIAVAAILDFRSASKNTHFVRGLSNDD